MGFRSGWRSRVSAMRHRDFRYLWLGNSLVMAGNQATFIAAGYLAYDLTDSALILGVVSMGFALPMLTLSLFGGALSDRLPRRRIIQIGQLLIAASAASVVAALYLGVVSWGHLLAASAVQGVAFAFVVPARQSLIVDIVGDDLAGNAVALVSISFSFTSLLGPALAGIMYDAVGAFGVYAAVLVADLLAVVCTGLVRQPGKAGARSRGKRSFLRDIGAGLRYARNDRMVVALIVVALAFTILAMPYRSLLPVLVVDVYGRGPRTLGLLSSMIGLGAILGSSYVAWVDLRRARRLVVVGAGLATGAAVATAGAIGFVGIVAPHLVRPLVDHDPARTLVPAALLAGVILVLADVGVRLAPGAAELRLGVVAALIGAPVFLWIAARRGTANG